MWAEAEAAQGLLSGRRFLVIAANLALIHYPGRLDAAATLHPDLLDGWTAQRRGNKDFRRFTPNTTAERWNGSSGLFAAQCALFEMGAAGVILCGVPMDAEAGHFTGRDQWEAVTSYRRAFELALPTIGARVRSMGGWSRELFGPPTEAWVSAIHTAKPLGMSPPAESKPMFSIKNVSKETKTFWANDAEGVRRLHRVEPGRSIEADIDPAQPRFRKGGGFEVKPVGPAPEPPAAKA